MYGAGQPIGSYADAISRDIRFVAEQHHQNDELTPEASRLQMLLEAYLDMRPWPDVLETISARGDSGLRLAILLNFTESMLRAAELTSLFERVLSTELARTYKRPSNDFEANIRFYCGGLGMELLDRFEDHAGFDGVMVGGKDAPYHRRNHTKPA